jgi:hypothetical protein
LPAARLLAGALFVVDPVAGLEFPLDGVFTAGAFFAGVIWILLLDRVPVGATSHL